MILSAPFWKQGLTITGIYIRSFPTAIGDCFEFLCFDPQDIEVATDEKGIYSEEIFKDKKKRFKTTRFSVGMLTGIEVALNDLKSKGFDGLHSRDRVRFTCVGISQADDRQGGKTESPDFKIDVERA